jgi:hypothetical protein
MVYARAERQLLRRPKQPRLLDMCGAGTAGFARGHTRYVFAIGAVWVSGRGDGGHGLLRTLPHDRWYVDGLRIDRSGLCDRQSNADGFERRGRTSLSGDGCAADLHRSHGRFFRGDSRHRRCAGVGVSLPDVRPDRQFISAPAWARYRYCSYWRALAGHGC